MYVVLDFNYLLFVVFLSCFLLYVIGKDAYVIEYSCFNETSTSPARVGVLDYPWLFSLILSILRGTY
jgi:hypothetical protein